MLKFVKFSLFLLLTLSGFANASDLGLGATKIFTFKVNKKCSMHQQGLIKEKTGIPTIFQDLKFESGVNDLDNYVPGNVYALYVDFKKCIEKSATKDFEGNQFEEEDVLFDPNNLSVGDIVIVQTKDKSEWYPYKFGEILSIGSNDISLNLGKGKEGLVFELSKIIKKIEYDLDSLKIDPADFIGSDIEIISVEPGFLSSKPHALINGCYSGPYVVTKDPYECIIQ